MFAGENYFCISILEWLTRTSKMSGTENFNELCRTCSAVTHIGSRQYIFESEGILSNIPLKLKNLPVHVSQNDHLPKVMCDSCIYKLDIVYDFIIKVKSTEIHLNSLLHYQSTVIKVEPDICAYSQDTEGEHTQNNCNLVSTQTGGNNLLNFKEESVEAGFGTHFLDSQFTQKHIPNRTNNISYVAPVDTYRVANTSPVELDSLSNEPQIIPQMVTNSCLPMQTPPVFDVEPDTPDLMPSKNAPINTYPCPINSNQPPMFYLCRFCRLPFPSHAEANTHIYEVHKKDQNDKEHISCTDIQTNPKHTEHSEGQAISPIIETDEPSSDTSTPSTSKSQKHSNNKTEFVPPFHACTSCHIVFPSVESLNSHMHNHKPLPECKVCGVKFSSEELLQKHMKKDEHAFSPQENKVWRCSECGKECRKRCKIQNHMRVHTGEKPFTCSFCPKAFSIKAQLTMHERKHKNDWCYICNYCGKGFYVKVYFDNHVRTTHTKEKPFKCDKCDSCYASKASLKEHILSKHNDGSLPIRIYECKSCGKKFKDNNSLYYHNKTHAATLEERRKHKCLVCNASFVKNHYLRKHMKIHTGENIEKFECHLCGKKLATSHGLDLHLVIHSGVKNFICDFCGKAFASESTLKTHIRCHTGEKPYQCRVCANFFTQRSSLLSHLKNIHNIDDRIRKIKLNNT